MESDKQNRKKSPLQIMKGLAKDIAVIACLYLAITTFAYAAFHIPSGSMEPTLEVGDRVFVAKYPYGYNRFTVPFDPAFIGTARLWESKPKRGDIVVFTLPYLDHTDFIKRVIGLPGDVIEVRMGRLYINAKRVPRRLVRAFSYLSYRGRRVQVTEYEETLPGDKRHRIYEQSDHARADNFGPYRVPADHFFMMGDNRDASGDSRELGRMGPVHKSFLVGRADITSFSLYDCDQGKDISCPLGVPLGRFFNLLE